MKDRFGRQRNLAPTGGTLPASLSRQFIGAPVPALQTRETLRPTAGGKYCWQASSLPNFAWNSRRVFGNGGRAIPYTIASGLLKQPDKQKIAKKLKKSYKITKLT